MHMYTYELMKIKEVCRITWLWQRDTYWLCMYGVFQWWHHSRHTQHVNDSDSDSDSVSVCLCVSAGGSQTGAHTTHSSSVPVDVVVLRNTCHSWHDATERS